MNAAANARIAAWKVIADQALPAGTKVIVEDGWVTIHPRGGRSASVPYSPTETTESLYKALTDPGLHTRQASRRQAVTGPHTTPGKNTK